MTPIKLIASDLDNTLLLADSTLPAGIFDRIRQLHAAGIEFVAASGRGVYTLEDLFAPVANQMSFVAENGGVIKRQGQVLAQNMLKPEETAEVVAYVRTQPDVIAIGNALDATYLDASEADYQPELSSFISRFAIAPDLTQAPVPMAKLSLYFRAGGAYAAFPRIEAQFGDRYGLTVGGETFIDVMPKTTNKGLGLTQLGAALNITPAEMMAFGDTNNDIQMMQTVKYGVLVANATPNMAAYADYRTASNLDLGVLKAIDGVLAGQLPVHV